MGSETLYSTLLNIIQRSHDYLMQRAPFPPAALSLALHCCRNCSNLTACECERELQGRRRDGGGVRCSMTLNIIIAAHTETRVVAKHETVTLAAANILRGVDL